jgi:hypothetical protein
VIRACIAAIVLSPHCPLRVQSAFAPQCATFVSTTHADAFDERIQPGLVLDSLIAPFESSDSLASPSRRIVRVQGSIEVDGNRARVCLMMLNVLARPITGPTRRRATRELDSVSRRTECGTRGYSRKNACRLPFPLRVPIGACLRCRRNTPHLTKSSADLPRRREMSDAGTARRKWTAARA